MSQQREPSDQWQGHLGFSFSLGAVTIGSDSEIIVEALGHYLAPVGPLSVKNCGLACPLLWAGALPPHCPGSSWTEALSRGDLSWLACGCFHLGWSGFFPPREAHLYPHFPLSETVSGGRNHLRGTLWFCLCDVTLRSMAPIINQDRQSQTFQLCYSHQVLYTLIHARESFRLSMEIAVGSQSLSES